MREEGRAAPDLETPVNPYTLLEAVNRSSDTAHVGWLIFLGVLAYLTVAVAGVTHQDLLLETPVELPLLNVPIQLKQFFAFAPVLIVLMHVGLLSQLTLLSREAHEFDASIRLLELPDRRTHPLRLELNNFFLVQSIAGSHRARVLSGVLHALSWLTVVLLPVVLLLYMQAVFLPYHHAAITWTHRLALVADLTALAALGAFLYSGATTLPNAAVSAAAARPVSFVATLVLFAVAAAGSFLIATVPGEMLDRVAQQIFKKSEGSNEQAGAAGGYRLPFLSASADGSLMGLFRRSLVVQDRDLVRDKEQTAGEASLSLRGRDLRYARLDRTDLHLADLTGADLTGASLTGTDLSGAVLGCDGIPPVAGAGEGEGRACTRLTAADLSGARLSGARLEYAQLGEAKLVGAHLEGARLAHAVLRGAEATAAHLQKADLTSVAAEGARLVGANLQGADLTGAALQGADLSAAALQTAMLAKAELEGTMLREANLEGATLAEARLAGADLSGTVTGGTDFRGALVWFATAPEADLSGVTDYTGLEMKPLDEARIKLLRDRFSGTDGSAWKRQAADALKPMLAEAEAPAWAGSPNQARWQALITMPNQPPPDQLRTRLTDYLARLMCKARWSDGAVATGAARRAVSQGFRGDLTGIYDRLKSDTCPAAGTVGPAELKELAAAADLVRPN